MPKLADQLQKMGIPLDKADGFRFGPGVVGKMTTVSVVALLMLGAVSVHAGDLIGVVIAAVVLVFLVFVGVVVGIVVKRPELALLEGAELLKYHAMEMGAKEITIDQNSPNTTMKMAIDDHQND